jgi:hypothetical protein
MVEPVVSQAEVCFSGRGTSFDQVFKESYALLKQKE